MSPVTLLILIGLIVLGIVWWSSRRVDGIDSNLLQACKGDRALVKRLLAQAKLKNPDKSERWYVEKVIYDLERDRSGSRKQPYYLSSGEVREKAVLFGSLLFITSMFSNLFRR